MHKIAVVTGAAQGLGLAIAKQCIQSGMHTILLDKQASLLQQQVNALKLTTRHTVEGIACDITQVQEIQFAAQTIQIQWGKIDLLINNAGILGSIATIESADPAQIQSVFDVNVMGMIHCIQAFLPLLSQTSEGHIVNMASFYGVCSGSQLAAYSMSKHAVVALSESLYFDFQKLKKSLSVSVVCPSFIHTHLLDAAVPHGDPRQQVLDSIMAHSRAPDDVAEIIMEQIKQRLFYILPDPEVKKYFEQRAQAILNQTTPPVHRIEKIFRSLI